MKKEKAKKIIGTVVTVLLAAVLILLFIAVGAVVAQIARGKTPSLLGYRFYYVMTDSMTPTYQVGDVVLGKVVTEKDADKLTVGTVVTYTAEFGVMEGNQVTHRIVKGVHYNEKIGDYAVITKGDKAGAALDEPVRVVRVNAIVVRKLVVATWVYGLVKSGSGFFVLLMIPMAIMLVVLIVRLAITLNANKAKQEEKKEETTEERVARLKKEAVEEYLKGKKDE